METQTSKFKIRLGLFVIVGLAIFVFFIFIIGKQKNLFNPVIKLAATFKSVSGLQVGNNVRFSGINVGTVDNINIVNDTTVLVEMIVKKDVQQFIKTDCVASIGSEGIIGDRILLISQSSSSASQVKDGQYITSIEPIETEAIISSLQVTTDNAAIISNQLAEIMLKINSGQGTLGKLLEDSSIAANLDQTIENLNKSSKGLNENMEAAKHNFLLRGYFNKKEKEAKKKEELKKEQDEKERKK